MSYWVEFAPESMAQLVAMEEHMINAGAAAAAIRCVDAIMAHYDWLATFPERGARRDDPFPGLCVTNGRGVAVIAFMVDPRTGSGVDPRLALRLP